MAFFFTGKDEESSCKVFYQLHQPFILYLIHPFAKSSAFTQKLHNQKLKSNNTKVNIPIDASIRGIEHMKKGKYSILERGQPGEMFK